MNTQTTLLNGSMFAPRWAMATAFADGMPKSRPVAFDGEGGQGDGGGQGGGAKPVDPNDPLVKALVEKAVAEATAGLKNNNTELLGEKKKVRDQLDEILNLFGGEEGIKRQKELQEKAAQDEEMKLVKDGKHDLWLERRTQGMREKHSQQISALEKRVQEVETERNQAIQNLIGYKTDQQLNLGADEAGVRPEYKAALTALVRNRVKLAEENGVEDWEVIGEDGLRAYSPNNSAKKMSVSELFDTFRDKMKDAFLPSKGSSASGGSKSGHTGPNPWAKETFNATVQGQMFRANPDHARRLAAEHGVKI